MAYRDDPCVIVTPQAGRHLEGAQRSSRLRRRKADRSGSVSSEHGPGDAVLVEDR